MSDLAIVALAAVTGWAVLISVAAGLLVRQTGLVTRWAKQQSENDGLEIGAPIPERVLVLLPGLNTGLQYLAILDASSQHGRDFALESGRDDRIALLKSSAAVTVALLGNEGQADELARLLPPWFELVSGDTAKAVQQNFKVRRIPTIFEIEGGRVTGRAGAGYGAVNFVNLVEARTHSNAADFAGASEDQ